MIMMTAVLMTGNPQTMVVMVVSVVMWKITRITIHGQGLYVISRRMQARIFWGLKCKNFNFYILMKVWLESFIFSASKQGFWTARWGALEQRDTRWCVQARSTQLVISEIKRWLLCSRRIFSYKIALYNDDRHAYFKTLCITCWLLLSINLR